MNTLHPQDYIPTPTQAHTAEDIPLCELVTAYLESGKTVEHAINCFRSGIIDFINHNNIDKEQLQSLRWALNKIDF
ncbi:MAG: hypothetical protein ABIT70_08325 [Sulfuriferula sp.]